jgi:membrane protease subunit HflK
VTRTNRVEVGFRTAGDGARARDMLPESLMLTGDENIIDIQFVVFWKIMDAGMYLFNVEDPEGTVHNVAEAAMREIVGQSPFELVRTQGRSDVQGRVLELIQQTLDDYGAGILVTQVELQKIDPPGVVIEAFRDVQAARADKERAINEAQAYFNEVTQRAAGQAQQIIKQAEAYKEEKIAIAKGDAGRFISVYDEYAKAKDLTTRRIYLETMEDVLKNIDKILIDDRGGGAVPYLSLNELIRQPQPQGRAAPQPEPAP